MAENKRKSVPVWAVVLIVALVGVGIYYIIRPAKQQLNVFNWTEYLPAEILDEFEKEYDVKINYDTFSSNEEMLAKLSTGASGYDIVVPSDYAVAIMSKQDLLLPLDKTLLPNLTNIEPRFLDQEFDPGNKFSVPYLWGTLGIAVNKEKVKDKISGWSDLWNPKYKGYIVAVDDMREIIGMALQTLGKSRNSTNPADLAAAKAKLKTLVPSIKAFDSDNPKALLLSGEAWLGVVWSGDAALAYRENSAIDYIMPAEGGGIWVDNLAVPKGSRHPELAHQFINFMLRPEIRARLAEAYPHGNPNKAAHALMPPEVLANPASYPPDAALAKAEWLQDVGDATKLYDEIWTEIKGTN